MPRPSTSRGGGGNRISSRGSSRGSSTHATRSSRGGGTSTRPSPALSERASRRASRHADIIDTLDASIYDTDHLQTMLQSDLKQLTGRVAKQPAFYSNKSSAEVLDDLAGLSMAVPQRTKATRQIRQQRPQHQDVDTYQRQFAMRDTAQQRNNPNSMSSIAQGYNASTNRSAAGGSSSRNFVKNSRASRNLMFDMSVLKNISHNFVLGGRLNDPATGEARQIEATTITSSAVSFTAPRDSVSQPTQVPITVPTSSTTTVTYMQSTTAPLSPAPRHNRQQHESHTLSSSPPSSSSSSSSPPPPPAAAAAASHTTQHSPSAHAADKTPSGKQAAELRAQRRSERRAAKWERRTQKTTERNDKRKLAAAARQQNSSAHEQREVAQLEADVSAMLNHHVKENHASEQQALQAESDSSDEVIESESEDDDSERKHEQVSARKLSSRNREQEQTARSEYVNEMASLLADEHSSGEDSVEDDNDLELATAIEASINAALHDDVRVSHQADEAMFTIDRAGTAIGIGSSSIAHSTSDDDVNTSATSTDSGLYSDTDSQLTSDGSHNTEDEQQDGEGTETDADALYGAGGWDDEDDVVMLYQTSSPPPTSSSSAVAPLKLALSADEALARAFPINPDHVAPLNEAFGTAQWSWKGGHFTEIDSMSDSDSSDDDEVEFEDADSDSEDEFDSDADDDDEEANALDAMLAEEDDELDEDDVILNVAYPRAGKVAKSKQKKKRSTLELTGFSSDDSDDAYDRELSHNNCTCPASAAFNLADINKLIQQHFIDRVEVDTAIAQSTSLSTLQLAPISSAVHRRQVHALAEMYTISSHSSGEGSERFTTLKATKHTANPPAKLLQLFLASERVKNAKVHKQVAKQYGCIVHSHIAIKKLKGGQKGAGMSTDRMMRKLRKKAAKLEKFAHKDKHRSKKSLEKRAQKQRSRGEAFTRSSEPPPVSRPSVPIADSNLGHRMLKLLGWSEGTGLGANNRGRTDPIQVQLKHGLAGIGHGSDRY